MTMPMPGLSKSNLEMNLRTKWYPQGDANCQLYLPLYDWDLRGAEALVSKDKNAHVCTITGATWGRQGRTYASGNVITTAVSTAFEAATAVTLSCWVNVDAAVPDITHLGIALNNRPTQTQRLELWVRRDNANGNKIALYNSVGGGVTSASSAAAVGSFSFITLVYVSSGTYTFYLNGVPDGTGAAAALPTWTTGTIVADIGNNASSLPFTGIFGEAWVHNDARTATEVMNDYLSIKWRHS